MLSPTTHTHECGICLNAIGANELRCGNCGALYTSTPITVPYAEARRRAESELGIVVEGVEGEPKATRTPLPGGARRLFEVEDIPIERIETGDEAIDLVTGGGFALGMAYAIHGPGGCGKSRVALRAAAAICAYRRPVVYASASAEETSEMVRLHAKDAGYFESPVVREHLITLDREDDPECIVRKIVALDPFFVVVDASSALDDEKYAARLLRDLSHATSVTILSVYHETVEGKMAGGSKIGYLVDAKLDVDPVARGKKGGWKPTEISPFMRLRSGKNRFARQGCFAILELTDAGYDVIEVCDGKTTRLAGQGDDDDGKGDRAAE